MFEAFSRGQVPTCRNPTKTHTHAIVAKTAKHRYDTTFWNACIMAYLIMTFNPSGDDDTRNDAPCDPTPRDVMRQRFHEQS